jgi:DNA-binding MarR family transcriptional regulator
LSHIVAVERNANLLGALGVAVSDVLWRNLGEAPVVAASEVAALVTVANYPGQPIEVLRATLGLTHSGAVRVVDRLQRAGLLTRVPAGRGRSVALTVTDAGLAQVERIQARRLAVLSRVLKNRRCRGASSVDAAVGEAAGRAYRGRVRPSPDLSPLRRTSVRARHSLSGRTRHPDTARGRCDAHAAMIGRVGLLVVVAVLWGVPYLFIKAAVQAGVSPFVIVFIRAGIDTLILLPFLPGSPWLPRLIGRWRVLLAVAVCDVVVPFVLISVGEQSVSSSLAGILVAATPLFVAVLAVWVDRSERPNRGQLIGLLLGFGGVAVLLSGGPDGLDGRGLAFPRACSGRLNRCEVGTPGVWSWRPGPSGAAQKGLP